MEELTMRAEDLLEILEQMKALHAQVAEFCTGRCSKCPLTHECLGDALMDVGEKYDIEKCADFLNFYDKVQAEKAKEEAEARQEDRLISAWEDANRWAGIDPQWARIRR